MSRLDGLRALLDRRLSIRQLLNLALMAGVGLGIYLLIGLVWAATHYQHLVELRGLDQLFSTLGEIVAWPVLIVADIQLR